MGGHRILVMGEGISMARVTRAKWLLDQAPTGAVEIVWAVPKRFRAVVEPAGATLTDLVTVDFKDYYANILGGKPPYSTAELEAYLAFDTALVDEVKPDALVYDFRPSVPVAAHRAGIPAVNVTNAFWSPFGERLFPVPESNFVRRVGLPLARLVAPVVAPMMVRKVHRPIFDFRRRHGLDDLGEDIFRLYGDGPHVWFPDTDDFAPTAGAPEAHRRLFPALWKPSGATYPEVPAGFGNARPLAYVSIGSTGNAALLPAIVAGLIEAGADVLVAAASHAVRLGTTPAGRVVEARYVDGDAACAKADLVVSNGGHPQLMQAWAQGTPVLGIAANVDQLVTMTHAERTGAALKLHVLSTTPRAVAATARRIFDDPSATAAAARQGEAIAAIDKEARMHAALKALFA